MAMLTMLPDALDGADGAACAGACCAGTGRFRVTGWAAGALRAAGAEAAGADAEAGRAIPAAPAAMRRLCPTEIRSALPMPFAATMSSAVTPKNRAMPATVSPGETV